MKGKRDDERERRKRWRLNEGPARFRQGCSCVTHQSRQEEARGAARGLWGRGEGKGWEKNIKQNKTNETALQVLVPSCSVGLCTVKTWMARLIHCHAKKEPEGAKVNVAHLTQKN